MSDMLGSFGLVDDEAERVGAAGHDEGAVPVVSVEYFVAGVAGFDVDDAEVVGVVVLEEIEVAVELLAVAALVLVHMELVQGEAGDGECRVASDHRLLPSG